jgi:prophage DNA circulation protein
VTDWAQKLFLRGEGSFRGKKFYVEKGSAVVGRRTVVHEFPGQDKATTEDMGMKARRLRLDAYVLGPEYMADRDALKIAFEEKGPGPLVHPYWGNFNVAVTSDIELTETTQEGGMARFSLDVTETATPAEPSKDTAGTVSLKGVTALAAVAAAFSAAFSAASGVTQFVRDAAQELINGVNGITSTLNKVKGLVNSVMNKVDAFGAAITDLASSAASLIALPGQLANRVKAVISDITAGVSAIGDAWDAYFADDEVPGSVAGTPSTSPTSATPASGDQRAELLMVAFRQMSVFGDDLTAVPEMTPTREIQAQNQAAFIAMVKATVAIATCQAVVKIPFASADKVTSVRDELSDALDDLIETADDTTYGPLVDLRVAMIEHLNALASDLPRVVDYTPTATLPALVIAQLLYGDATRETEIIERNGLRNPCLVSAGVPIEVLSDE